MLELYWLPALERMRQSPNLVRITQSLYAQTWAAAARGFRLKRSPPPRPLLQLYIDRCSLRLPSAALERLIPPEVYYPPLGPPLGGRFILKIPVPPEVQRLQKLLPKPLPGLYEVASVMRARGTGVGRHYLVRWLAAPPFATPRTLELSPP